MRLAGVTGDNAGLVPSVDEVSGGEADCAWEGAFEEALFGGAGGGMDRSTGDGVSATPSL